MSGAEGQELLLPKGRTIPINGDAVRTLRIQKKLSHEYLAHSSNISVDRLMEIEKGGQRVYQVNFMAIAQALGLGNDWRPLLQGTAGGELATEPGSAIQEQRRRKIKVVLGGGTKIDLSTSPEAVSQLFEHLIDSKNIIITINITIGSIIVELELSEEDLLRLVAAFTETRLDTIHVEAIHLPATTGPLAAGLLQIIHPGEVVADAMTDPATETMTLLRNPNQAVGFSVKEAPAAHKTITIRDRVIVWLRRHWILAASALLLMIVAAILTYYFAVRRGSPIAPGRINHSMSGGAGMIVYAFFNPHTDQGRRDWERLITARTNHPTVPLRVVIFPKGIDSSVADKAIQSGIQLYAAIDCDKGEQRPDALIQQVEQWHKQHADKLAGFFFFRPALDKDHVADYANVFKTVRGLSHRYSIITCCWFRVCDEGFLSIAASDVICIQTDGFFPELPIWVTKYEPSRFGAIIAGVPNLPKAEEYVKHATENHMNWIYAAPGDGWLQLPRFFEDEIAYIASLNAEVRGRGIAPKK